MKSFDVVKNNGIPFAPVNTILDKRKFEDLDQGGMGINLARMNTQARRDSSSRRRQPPFQQRNASSEKVNLQSKKLFKQKKVWQLPTFPPRKAVSSALESLTSVFGMGTGIASPLWPPDIYYFVLLLRANPLLEGRTKLLRKMTFALYHGINNMVKPHDLLVLLG